MRTVSAKLSELNLSCEAFFQSTLEAEVGIELTTINAYRARMILYKYRYDFGRTEYDKIQIRFSPDDPEHDLWLLNITTETEG